MLELGSSGSVRGVSSNGHPYRDPRAWAGVPASRNERPLPARGSPFEPGTKCFVWTTPSKQGRFGMCAAVGCGHVSGLRCAAL